MLRKEGYGTIFESPITHEQCWVVGFAFVDDTDLVTIPNQQETARPYQQIITEMQATLNTWEGGIRASGGAIVPDKSHWYLIDFKWQNGCWSYATEAETPGDVSVKDSTGERRNLKRLDVKHAYPIFHSEQNQMTR